ncbi:hypothetical protein ABH935_001754, partial [Catenulispora sp. GAS73]
MRKAILPGVGVVVMVAALAGCGSSGESTGVGSTGPRSGHTSQQAGATSGGPLGGGGGGAPPPPRGGGGLGGAGLGGEKENPPGGRP